MYETEGSWRNIWHYIWKAIDSNNEITFNELYNDPYTQKMIQGQLHNIGPDNTKTRFKDMFSEIKEKLCGADVECDEEEEVDVVTESLYRKIKRLQRAEINYERLVEKVVRRQK